jgi:hypothetical protein
MSNSSFVYQSGQSGLQLYGLGEPPQRVRQRAEKIKRVYLVGAGETLLERMKVEVPRRINYQETGATHVPTLINYYNSLGADPERVAKAWKAAYPDLFPGGINDRYDSNGNVVSGGGSGSGGGLPAITTAGGGNTMLWVAGGAAAIGAAYLVMRKK